jgi:hypothetical protein
VKIFNKQISPTGLPPPSLRIKDALEKCPIQTEYFKKESKSADRKKSGKFKDKLLCSLDSYLDELRTKNQTSFITDGIEAKTDISKLGMSDSQLKKLNRVRDADILNLTLHFP